MRNHGFGVKDTTWIPVFKGEKDADIYGMECEVEFEVCGVDTKGWYGKGVVVVDATDLRRVGKGKLSSELLVLMGWEMDGVLATKYACPTAPTIETEGKIQRKR